MSKAKTPIKVLKTAIKRLNKGWTKGEWLDFDRQTGEVKVCLEGAIFGFCMEPQTDAQREAKKVCEQIILERWVDGEFQLPHINSERDKELVLEAEGRGLIPSFNDKVAKSVDELVEICKLAIIRLETGGPIDEDEFIEFDLDGEELMDLLPKKA